MADLTSSALRKWRERGKVRDIFGHRVFTLDAGPQDSKATPLAVLHGFPTSSHDFAAVVDRLAEDRRVVLFDFLGFGLSSKPEDYSYSLLEQAETAIGLYRELGLDRVHLLAHDYGTSVATELLARREHGLLPFELGSVTLCNGSMHIELAQITAAQKVLRNKTVGPLLSKFASRGFFASRMKGIWGDPSRLRAETVDAMFEGMTRDGGRERMTAISQYLHERTKFWHRWIGALTRLDIPAHVLWGKRDPIAVAAIAEQLDTEIPVSKLTWLDDLGHYPMVEDPNRWASAAVGFLKD